MTAEPAADTTDDPAAAPAAVPERGRGVDELLAEVDARHAEDLDWRGGRAFSLVYHPDDDELEHLLEEVGRRFLHENALNPFKYPSLLGMELEVIAMACGLFGTAPDAGALTSGGTESIFCAVQVARDHARTERGIAEPQLVTPSTAHPAFAKAAKYLDVEHVLVPVGPDGRADPVATADAMGDRAGLVVGSAPCYPFGVMDPIGELAGLAADRGVLFHTDACLGGWLLPWWERLGEPVAPWDFRVPGVTSLSADVHKYGYAFKGASIVAYRDRSLLRHQFFWYDDWPGGLYASGTTAGTRPAAPIVGAWAAISKLGAEGYLRMAEVVRDTTRRFSDGIDGIDGVRVTHPPDLSVMEVGVDPHASRTPDIGAVADVMDDRGWNLDRQQGGLHLMVSPYHAKVVDQFLADLADAVAVHGPSRGRAATYGGVAGGT
ncbi:MAG: aspartate aminotransferase family protein [Acidimicrobiia bacterium]|nr:aspartate aminotransferase family protein [Acidimicrobiia bacterium]